MTQTQLKTRYLTSVNLPVARQMLNDARLRYKIAKQICRLTAKLGKWNLWSDAMREAKQAKRALRASIAWVELGLYGVESKHKVKR